jgi:sugar phosphate isomerase/epimerase
LKEVASVVEATTLYPYPFNLPVPRATLREIRTTSRDLGLTLLVHGPIWELYTASIYPEVRCLGVERIKQAVDFAVQIDAVHMTLHPGPSRWPGVWPQLQEQALDAQRRSFVEIDAYASRAGIRLGIENMLPGERCLRGYDDLSEVFTILDHVPSIGVTLDVGHLLIANVEPVGIIHRLDDRLSHLHVHDNHGREDEHLAVGEGDIEWQPVLQALIDIGYQGYLEIERSLADGGVEASITRLASTLVALTGNPPLATP